MAMDSQGNFVTPPRPLNEQVFRSLIKGPHIEAEVFTNYKGEIAVVNEHGALRWYKPADINDIVEATRPVVV
jgi:hypothetical protein